MLNMEAVVLTTRVQTKHVEQMCCKKTLNLLPNVPAFGYTFYICPPRISVFSVGFSPFSAALRGQKRYEKPL